MAGALRLFMIITATAPWLTQCQKIQTLRYRTGTVTTCLALPEATEQAAAPPPNETLDISLGGLHSAESTLTCTVAMPECSGCSCPTCTHTNIYTTKFNILGPSGLIPQTYVVKEIYRGMSAFPVVDATRQPPLGFAATVTTCSSCGNTPITATLTLPTKYPAYTQRLGGFTVAPVATLETTARSAQSTAPTPSKCFSPHMRYVAAKYLYVGFQS
jgi:hypothetical protein